MMMVMIDVMIMMLFDDARSQPNLNTLVGLLSVVLFWLI